MFERTYEINSFLVNSQRRLGLFPLLNLLQDAASTHADELGFGYKDMIRRGTFWVLTRQRLDMQAWPAWHEKLTIKTWIRFGGGPFSNRDFRIFHDGQQIGECTTTWVALDGKTRKPVSIDRSGLWEKLTDHGQVSFEAEKISRLVQSEKLATFTVRNSDIDQNQHVNNTRYAQWVLDAIPMDWHHRFNLLSYSVNFLSETLLGDTISIYRHEGHFEGVRETDQKCVFTARLTYQDR